jgi:protein-tyrosine phosphatase
MTEIYERHLKFGSVMNFRDIGGYPARRGRTVAWRHVFRSGEFRNLTPEDLHRLTNELGVGCVIDLRSGFEVKKHGKGLLTETDLKYYHIEFMSDGGDPKANAKRYEHCTNMGEFYIELVQQKEFGQKIVEALEVIAEPKNYPLVFHCAVGKDRTGMLAAMLLSLLGVGEDEIIKDYALSEPYMDALLEKIRQNPKEGEGVPKIPEYFWKAPAESMKLLLVMLKKEYGGVAGYLKEMGMAASLPAQLKKGLLV